MPISVQEVTCSLWTCLLWEHFISKEATHAKSHSLSSKSEIHTQLPSKPSFPQESSYWRATHVVPLKADLAKQSPRQDKWSMRMTETLANEALLDPQNKKGRTICAAILHSAHRVLGRRRRGITCQPATHCGIKTGRFICWGILLLVSTRVEGMVLDNWGTTLRGDMREVGGTINVLHVLSTLVRLQIKLVCPLLHRMTLRSGVVWCSCWRSTETSMSGQETYEEIRYLHFARVLEWPLSYQTVMSLLIPQLGASLLTRPTLLWMDLLYISSAMIHNEVIRPHKLVPLGCLPYGMATWSRQLATVCRAGVAAYILLDDVPAHHESFSLPETYHGPTRN
jgi:hypothetical protein